MDKSTRNIILFIGLILIGLVIAFQFTEKPIDWSASYNTKDKIPFGLYVFDHEIDSFFHTYVERSKGSIDEYFYDGFVEDSSFYSYNLLYINEVNHWSENDVNKLCDFVKIGNTAFISSTEIPLDLADSLHLDVVSHKYFHNDLQLTKTKFTLFLSDSCDFHHTVSDNVGLSGSFFSYYDTINSRDLGRVDLGSVSRCNFIEVHYGLGTFYVHLEPAVFTNFHMLKSQHHVYVEDILSYIPKDFDIIWSLNDQTSKVISDSPFRFIKSQPSLYWALMLLVIGSLLFVIFNIRRTQRIIKVMPKLTNTSVDFAKSIANLYYLDDEIIHIMDKKVIYLLEKIRSDYHINTDTLDDKFVTLLKARSGKDFDRLNIMITLVKSHQKTRQYSTKEDLIRLNEAIENVFNQ